MGYRVATVWECSIKSNFKRTVELLDAFIRGDEDVIEI